MNTSKVMSYFRAGFEERQWYNATFTHIEEIFEDDAPLFCDILAATSANTSVKGNVTLALKAYQQYKNDRAFVGYLPVVVSMLNQIRENYETGIHKPFGSDKIQAFALALKGDLTQCVVDRWILRAYGITGRPTPKRARDIKAHCQKIAKRYGVTVSEAQAAIWCGIKKALAGPKWKSTDTIEFHLIGG